MFLILVCEVMLFTSVAAQPGFLSLDCGGDTSSDAIGIEWISDKDYIHTGTTSTVSSEYVSNLTVPYQTLRYFDTTKKHCYSLPVEAYETYLLRPSFNYGNYDKLDQKIIRFHLLVGINSFFLNYNPDLNNVQSYEFIVRVGSSRKLDFCLVSDTTTVPFISTLELRLLEMGMYNLSVGAILLTRQRVNLGTSSSQRIRYKDDPYDRYWSAMRYASYQNISTDLSVKTQDTRDKPPPIVMSTAITSMNDMHFSLGVTSSLVAVNASYAYLVNFYFAELNTNLNVSRVFSVSVDSSAEDTNVTTGIQVDITNIGPLISFESTEIITQTTFANFISFILAPSSGSTLGPILNAAELFEYILINGRDTQADDVKAVEHLRGELNLSTWSGDPCFPTEYHWDWIRCNSEGSIVGLNLSHRQLRGFLPSSIKELVHLEKIYMDHNNLDGQLPDLSSLDNLTILHLENNNLGGSFELKNLPGQLRYLYLGNNKNLCVSRDVQLKFNLSESICENTTNDKKKKVIIGVTVPVALLVVLILALYVCLKLAPVPSPTNLSKRELSSNPDTPFKSPREFAPNVTQFTYEELLSATDTFKDRVGEGSFGPVYRGRLPNGEDIAVKVHSGSSSQGIQEFNNEVELLSKVHHRNVVSFLGYCTHEVKLILVYEFLANGTLRDNLYGGTNTKPLHWMSRLRIALEAAQGLEYLHFMCNTRIIHRDVKSTNILLSSNMVAKVTDFGLSKAYKMEDKDTHISTLVKGTPGYLDPEYHSLSRLTEKSDVYSFGVVLLEIMCGRGPVNVFLPEEQVSLVKWARNQLGRGNLKIIMDPSLEVYSEQVAWKVAEVAMTSTEYESVNRPDMRMVVSEIREAIKLEEQLLLDNIY